MDQETQEKFNELNKRVSYLEEKVGVVYNRDYNNNPDYNSYPMVNFDTGWPAFQSITDLAARLSSLESIQYTENSAQNLRVAIDQMSHLICFLQVEVQRLQREIDSVKMESLY